MRTLVLGKCEVTLVSGFIKTEPAMGMIYSYSDLPDVKIDAVSCTASFRGFDITRAVEKRFELPTKDFMEAGRICNEKLEVCVIPHKPAIILTPRVANFEHYTVEDATKEMAEILEACHQCNAETLRLTHFAMILSPSPLEHLGGIRDGIMAWQKDLPKKVYMDIDDKYLDEAEGILKGGKVSCRTA